MPGFQTLQRSAEAAKPELAQSIRVDRTPLPEAWDDYVRTQPFASIYHQYAWRDVIARAHGTRTHYLAAIGQDGVISGVLPLARLNSIFFGDFLVSLPYFNYGGVLASTAEAEVALFQEAIAVARDLGVGHLELRHVSRMSFDLPTRTDKVTMILDLPHDPATLLRDLGSKIRSQIRRPEREGATGESGGAELLEEFYSVFAQKMRDLGTPVYGRALFEEILLRFPGAARIFVVRMKGQAVAVGLTLSHRRRMEVPWAASLREFDRVSVNMLLYWHMIEHAIAAGNSQFDFGRCTRDSGPHRFKRQWGAAESQLYWHYWMSRGNEPPMLNHANAKYSLAGNLWRHLPLAVANWLGPLIVKNLP